LFISAHTNSIASELISAMMRRISCVGLVTVLSSCCHRVPSKVNVTAKVNYGLSSHTNRMVVQRLNSFIDRFIIADDRHSDTVHDLENP